MKSKTSRFNSAEVLNEDQSLSMKSFNKNQSKGQVKISTDQLLARSKIGYREVSKYYFQWFNLLLIHAYLFFYLPISGNYFLSQNTDRYCSK